MTEDEVIRELNEMKNDLYALGYFENPEKESETFDMAIAALKEIQQYREIGTAEECRKAVEKQEPKKIIIRNWRPTRCPTCGHELSTSLGDGYYKHPTFLERCPECGQAIQWEWDED